MNGTNQTSTPAAPVARAAATSFHSRRRSQAMKTTAITDPITGNSVTRTPIPSPKSAQPANDERQSGDAQNQRHSVTAPGPAMNPDIRRETAEQGPGNGYPPVLKNLTI